MTTAGTMAKKVPLLLIGYWRYLICKEKIAPPHLENRGAIFVFKIATTTTISAMTNIKKGIIRNKIADAT